MNLNFWASNARMRGGGAGQLGFAMELHCIAMGLCRGVEGESNEMRIQKSPGYARATCPSWRPHCRKPSVACLSNQPYSKLKLPDRTVQFLSVPSSSQFLIPSCHLSWKLHKSPTPAYGTTFSGSLSGDMPATCISLFGQLFSGTSTNLLLTAANCVKLARQLWQVSIWCWPICSYGGNGKFHHISG